MRLERVCAQRVQDGRAVGVGYAGRAARSAGEDVGGEFAGTDHGFARDEDGGNGVVVSKEKGFVCLFIYLNM